MTKPKDAEAYLREALEDLDGCCCYWACPGPDHPPVAMATCGPCATLYKIKGYFARKSRKALDTTG